MIKYLKEKLAGIAGSVSGIASVLGSWQVCHTICLAIVALLAVIGITIVGMPLAFLTTVAVPLWTIAFILLLVTFGLYFKKGCISKKLLLFNSGVIIAGVPFQPVQDYQKYLWVIGGLIVAASIYMFVMDKINKKNNECHMKVKKVKK